MLPPADTLRDAALRSRGFATGWRAGPGCAHARATLDAVGAGPAEAVADAAAELIADDGWVAAMLDPLVAALAADPWFEPPTRANRDPPRSGAILFEHPAATITASVLSAAVLRDTPLPATVVAPGRLSVIRYVRAGGARVARWAMAPVADPVRAATMGRCQPQATLYPADGDLVRHDGRVAAQLLTAASSDVVTVTATARVGAAPVMREYDRVSGAFVRMATTDEGAARAQMLLTLLRVAGAADAGACFDAATRDGAFFLRWSAMREWLAHDWRAAWARLEEMAATDPHPDVRATAAATRVQLSARIAA